MSERLSGLLPGESSLPDLNDEVDADAATQPPDQHDEPIVDELRVIGATPGCPLPLLPQVLF